MAGHGRKNQDEQRLLTLGCGATVEAAARAVGLSEATVYRRLRDPAFRQRIQEVRADLLDRTSAMLTAAGGEFVKTLLALIKESIPPAVRLGAARAGLAIGLKIREVVDLEQRLAALEAAQQAQNGAGRNGRHG